MSLADNYNYHAYHHRIRVGTWAAADLTSTYDVSAFTVQADQHFPWGYPIDPSGQIREVDAIVEAFDGSQGAFGKYSLTWIFGRMTPMMIQYAKTRMLNGLYSSPVSIITWSRSEGWIALNCTAQWKLPADIGEPKGNHGYRNLKIVEFVEGVIAA